MYAKLDGYDYQLVMADNKVMRIIVYVEGALDTDISDISTEINSNNGRVYVEGYYCRMVNMTFGEDPVDGYYLSIEVIEEENNE